MDLYYGRVSGNSARAMFGLLESGAPWHGRVLDLRAGEGRTTDYQAVNPMGKVPSLRDGAFQLWESNAINWYVAEKYSEANLLPRTPQGRASVQRWLLFQTGHVSPACTAVFRATHTKMRAMWGNPQVDEKAVEAGRKDLARFLPVLEGVLEGRDYLEETFSLADIAFVPHFVVLGEAGFDFGPYPRLHAWLEWLCARPAWKETYTRVFGG